MASLGFDPYMNSTFHEDDTAPELLPAVDQPAATDLATAPVTSVPPIVEPVLDPGPTDPESLTARTLSIQDLLLQASSASGRPKAAARAELRRRGVTASAAPTTRRTPR
jgi:hypothetical protein